MIINLGPVRPTPKDGDRRIIDKYILIPTTLVNMQTGCRETRFLQQSKIWQQFEYHWDGGGCWTHDMWAE